MHLFGCTRIKKKKRRKNVGREATDARDTPTERNPPLRANSSNFCCIIDDYYYYYSSWIFTLLRSVLRRVFYPKQIGMTNRCDIFGLMRRWVKNVTLDVSASLVVTRERFLHREAILQTNSSAELLRMNATVNEKQRGTWMNRKKRKEECSKYESTLMKREKP